SNTAMCGGSADPCASVATGISRALAVGLPKVYVAAGLYTEAITLPQQSNGIRIEGAWNANGAVWSPICSAGAEDAVTIQAPNNTNTTVTANALGGQAALAWLTIKSKPTASSGESLYGVFATGNNTLLTLENVRVVVANGGDGVAGGPGANGVDGAT